MSFPPEIEAEFVKILRSARAALQVDAVAIVRGERADHAVSLAESSDGFDVHATIKPALLDQVVQTRRTAIVRARSSIVVVPIGADPLIGMLYVVRSTDAGFDGADVANVELIARELARVHAEGGTPPPLVPLQRDSILDEFELDDVSSIVTGEVEPELGSDTGPGPLLAFGDLQATPLLSDESLHELLANSVTSALRLTEGHVAAVVLACGDPFSVLALGATADAPDVPPTQLISATMVERVFETGLPVLTFDAREHELGPGSTSIQTLGVTTVMCVPLLTKGARAVSALYCATFGIGGKFDAPTLAALMAAARKLTPVLDNLGQFDGCG